MPISNKFDILEVEDCNEEAAGLRGTLTSKGPLSLQVHPIHNQGSEASSYNEIRVPIQFKEERWI